MVQQKIMESVFKKGKTVSTVMNPLGIWNRATRASALGPPYESSANFYIFKILNSCCFRFGKKSFYIQTLILIVFNSNEYEDTVLDITGVLLTCKQYVVVFILD